MVEKIYGEVYERIINGIYSVSFACHHRFHRVFFRINHLFGYE